MTPPKRMALFIFAYALLLLAIVFLLGEPGNPNTLYPAMFGGLLLLLAALALKQDLRLIASHGATIVTLIAFVTTLGAAYDWVTVTDADPFDGQKALMSLLSLLFLSLFVYEFIHGRKQDDRN